MAIVSVRARLYRSHSLLPSRLSPATKEFEGRERLFARRECRRKSERERESDREEELRKRWLVRPQRAPGVRGGGGE
jgi:hypothetical protein